MQNQAFFQHFLSFVIPFMEKWTTNPRKNQSDYLMWDDVIGVWFWQVVFFMDGN